jgi:hypothetical protein
LRGFFAAAATGGVDIDCDIELKVGVGVGEVAGVALGKTAAAAAWLSSLELEAALFVGRSLVFDSASVYFDDDPDVDD